jgi:hypothetical protein
VIKRFMFLLGISAASTAAAGAQATVTSGRVGNGFAGSNASLTPQAMTADIEALQKSVAALQAAHATLAKQVAALNKHTHTYYGAASETSGLFSIDSIKNYIAHNQGNYGDYLVPVRSPSYTPSAGPAVQTSPPVMQ